MAATVCGRVWAGAGSYWKRGALDVGINQHADPNATVGGRSAGRDFRMLISTPRARAKIKSGGRGDCHLRRLAAGLGGDTVAGSKTRCSTSGRDGARGGTAMMDDLSSGARTLLPLEFFTFPQICLGCC